MNIVSYNIRGLRRGVKWAAIRRMVRKQKVDMICIHETKRELIRPHARPYGGTQMLGGNSS